MSTNQPDTDLARKNDLTHTCPTAEDPYLQPKETLRDRTVFEQALACLEKSFWSAQTASSGFELSCGLVDPSQTGNIRILRSARVRRSLLMLNSCGFESGQN